MLHLNYNFLFIFLYFCRKALTRRAPCRENVNGSTGLHGMDLDMEEFHNRLYVVRANECPDKLLAELRTPKADKADKEETERANERERERE